MPVLEIQSISKHYGGVKALSDVCFAVEGGERHALLGENGAGKSTLVKILSGNVRADSGAIALAGERYAPSSPAEARRAGVIVVPQELSYCPNLSVAENLLLGELPSRLGWVQHRRIRDEALARLQRAGLSDINPDWAMARLSTGQAQAAQIAGAIASHPRLLLLDEPTSALSRGETARLAQILSRLREERVTVLYVSHRLEEIFGSSDSGFSACNTYTVLRDGKHIETAALMGKSHGDIVKAMVGREISLLQGDAPPPATGPVRLKVENLGDAVREKFNAISLEVRGGEILGLGGLVGAGRTELARALVGLDRGAGGSVWIDGRIYEQRNLRESLRRGMVYLTEDRKREGLVLGLSAVANWSLPFASRFGRLGRAFLMRGQERREACSAFERLQVKTADPDKPVQGLSGGNQQKVLFARWLSVQPEPGVILLDEPTRGVDVKAKAEIHRLIGELAARGAAVMVISSDLPELLSLCSRMIVMRRGTIAGELSRAAMSETAAGQMMI